MSLYSNVPLAAPSETTWIVTSLLLDASVADRAIVASAKRQPFGNGTGQLTTTERSLLKLA